jgi:hypothetical protein
MQLNEQLEPYLQGTLHDLANVMAWKQDLRRRGAAPIGRQQMQHIGGT